MLNQERTASEYAPSASAPGSSSRALPYPLTPLQQGMLYHALAESASGVDIEQLLLTLTEEVALPQFKQSWERVTERHEILRSAFQWEGAAEPTQSVLSPVTLNFIEHDWRAVSPDAQQALLAGLLKTDRHTDFDLAKPPLMRFNLVRLGTADYRFLWTFHHALMDGRSFPIVLEEVFAFYEAALSGKTLNLPKPRPYRDHVEWLRSQDFEQSRDFWQSRLKSFSHPTPLGLDQEVGRAAGEAPVYCERTLTLSEADTQRLREFARSIDVTVNTVFQAAWAILLGRYSGETDVIFGGTRACRQTAQPGLDSTVGLFINTLPVRASVDPESPLLTLLQTLRSDWIAMREHEHTPLNKVKTWSSLPPGSSLFESIVVFENFLLDTRLRALGGAWQNRSVAYFGQTNFPLTVMGYLDRGLSIVIGYDQRRFTDTTIEAMLHHLETLLAAMPGAAEKPIGSLPLLTKSERDLILREWNATKIDYEHSGLLHHLFEAQARKTPNAIAVQFSSGSLSYAELDQRANQLARFLRSLGVGPDQLVGVCMERSLPMVVALYGILKAGGAYVPIDPEYPRDRIAFMLSDAGVSVLLSQQSVADSLPENGARVICLDREWELISREAETKPSDEVAPGHLAYMIYTSGSTGRPKGAMNTHRGICNRLLWMQEQYQLNPTDAVLQKTPFSFDVSVWEFFWPLFTGAKLVMAKPGGHKDPAYLVELINAANISVLHFVPSMLRVFLQDPGASTCRTLRHVVCSGEALPFDLQQDFFSRLSAQLHNLYGPTEAAVDVSHWTCERDSSLKVVPIGRPVANTQLYVLGPRLQPVPVGVPGELYIGGVQVGRGYHNRAELTAAIFIADPFSAEPNARIYKTGDLCRFLPDGNIEYLSRLDFQVKLRGLRIELGEIEVRLAEHADISHAVVMARADGPGEKRLVGYLVSRYGKKPSTAELKQHLVEKLPEFMAPSAFVWLSELPLSPNGKIDRKALPAPELDGAALAASYLAPRTPTEIALAQIWGKVLRLPLVGLNDNFFELGGDSILSIQIISLARQAGITLSPKLIFQHQTILQLASVAASAVQPVPLEQGLVQGTAPLTPIQHWFFEQQLNSPHYFNQAFLFTAKARLDLSALTKALSILERHHDVLRLRFSSDESEPVQTFGDASLSPAIEVVDFSQVVDADLASVIASVAIQAQASLDLRSGPLWRTVSFDLGLARQPRLLIVVHHLAVDGVSWRILLEDLEHAYESVLAHREVQLPPKTTSFQHWANRLKKFAQEPDVSTRPAYWHEAAAKEFKGLPIELTTGENNERSTRVVTTHLTAAETDALLQKAPAAYNTQINDLLLAALTRAVAQWTGRDHVALNLEGHGREDLWEGLDLSRTVGWFTSIYPVRIQCPVGPIDSLIKSVKEQLRAIPGRGIGFGLQRYLNGDERLAKAPEPQILFNYLGQFDQVVRGSRHFQFAPESTGPWHSPDQIRRHLLEVNCLVAEGRLAISWTYSLNRHRSETAQHLAERFAETLRELLAHCTTPGIKGATPADFALAALDQPSLDQLLGKLPDLEDVYSLTPVQTLFYSAAAKDTRAVTDQWHCTLNGPLVVKSFQEAWQRVIAQHSVLRTSFHAAGLKEPVQVVHQRCELPWRILDWSALSEPDKTARWAALLEEERGQGIALDRAPLHRMVLVRLNEVQFKFLWVVPALLLDGWSWPLVFRDLSRYYEELQNGSAAQSRSLTSYRDYVAWLSQRRADQEERFWRAYLQGIRQPTPLPSEPAELSRSSPRQSAQWSVTLDETVTARLVATARQLRITPSSVALFAWGIVLARLSGRTDVVFGAAFSSRPTDLPDAGEIVGPFSNNLPIRLSIDEKQPLEERLSNLHQQLLDLNPHQFASLAQIQDWSEVPWHERLFESLVVVQNYQVDESARRLGDNVTIEEFSGPIHTAFPLLVLVEPGTTWRITLIHDRRALAAARVIQWGQDIAQVLTTLAGNSPGSLSELNSRLSLPAAVHSTKARFRVESLNYLPPQTPLEHVISSIWQQMFQLDRISVEENLFDLGAHSLFVTRLHQRLRKELSREFPLVDLFQYPTISSFAQHLDGRGKKTADTRIQTLAQQQRDALARMRRPVLKK